MLHIFFPPKSASVWYSSCGSHPRGGDSRLTPETDACLFYCCLLLREVNTRMKLSDRGMDVLIGVVLGATIGLHYPLDAFKLLFVIMSVVGILKLAVK